MKLTEQIDIIVEVENVLPENFNTRKKLIKLLNFLQKSKKEIDALEDKSSLSGDELVIPNPDYKNNPILKQYIKVIDVVLGNNHLSGKSQEVRELNNLMKQIYK